MNNQPKDPPSSPTPRRLLRSRQDRYLLGVAGGLAEYLRVDPTLVRAGFLITALFGGAGLVAYLVLALAAPEDDGSGRAVVGERPPLWLIVTAAIVLLIVLPGPFWGMFDGFGLWWWGWGGGWLLLLGLAGLAAYLLLRDRDQPPGASGGGEGRPRGTGEAPPSAARSPASHATPPAGAPAGGGPGGGSDERVEETDEGSADRSEQTTATAELVEPRRAHPLLRATAIAIIALAALAAASAIAVLSAWAVATGNGQIPAAVVIALGVILVATSFTGPRRATALILPALLIGLPAGAMAASEIRFDGAIGEREYRPTTTTAIPDDGYRLGVGQLIVDLQGLPWEPGEAIEVATDLGVGRTVVSIPSGVCVEFDANASVGEVHVLGQRSGGIDPDLSETPPSRRAPRLVLHSRVDIGQLTVSHRPADELVRDDARRSWRGPDDAEERDDARRACETREGSR